MLDDIFDLVMIIADGIIDFFIGQKEKRNERKRQKEAKKEQRKADRERPL